MTGTDYVTLWLQDGSKVGATDVDTIELATAMRLESGALLGYRNAATGKSEMVPTWAIIRVTLPDSAEA